ncbi:MAG: hypothetical protein ACQEQF_10145 [Bacillota bacterium]
MTFAFDKNTNNKDEVINFGKSIRNKNNEYKLKKIEVSNEQEKIIKTIKPKR